jgi:hypothetical protein
LTDFQEIQYRSSLQKLVGETLQRILNIHGNTAVIYIRFQVVKTTPAEGVKEKSYDIYHKGKGTVHPRTCHACPQGKQFL